MIQPVFLTATSINGKIHFNKDFNGSLATTLYKSQDLIFDNFDKTIYYSLVINLSNKGKVIWFFDSQVNRDAEYTRLITEIPESGGGGDVIGAPSSQAGTVAVFDDTSGKLLRTSLNFFASSLGNVGIGTGSNLINRLQVRTTGTQRGINVVNSGGVPFFRTGTSTILDNSFNTSNSCLQVSKVSSNDRSLNASGTINSSGADFAEYISKNKELIQNNVAINKGDVIGLDVNGFITNKFSQSLSFAVKSTKPNLVGGDIWAVTPTPNPELYETEEEYTIAYNEWLIIHEVERFKVDRIAFCGVCPVNYNGSFEVGDYIVPIRGQNDSINVIAVSKDNISFEQYKNRIGQVKEKSEVEEGVYHPIIIVSMG